MWSEETPFRDTPAVAAARASSAGNVGPKTSVIATPFSASRDGLHGSEPRARSAADLTDQIQVEEPFDGSARAIEGEAAIDGHVGGGLGRPDRGIPRRAKPDFRCEPVRVGERHGA